MKVYWKDWIIPTSLKLHWQIGMSIPTSFAYFTNFTNSTLMVFLPQQVIYPLLPGFAA